MELSKRLNWIIEKIDKCSVVMDVGTDHGYIPIQLIKNNIADKVIASDINKDPLDKAKINASFEGVSKNMDFRLGGGLVPLKNEEKVDAVIIAGMGGNLVRDILENDIEKVKKIDFLILQPAQNPEVLREYLYTSDYEIIEEDVCLDEGKFYELFKVRYKQGEYTKLDPIFYEISIPMLKSKSPVYKEYLNNKIEHYNKVVSFIKDDTEHAINRKNELKEKIKTIEELIKEL